MELLLIRHGLPQRIETNDGSPADPELSASGWIQAKAMAVWLSSENITSVYASPMRRAHQTAEPLAEALNLTIALDPRVAEFDQHESSYIPMEELKAENRPAWDEFVLGNSDRDLTEFRSRVVEGLTEIAASHKGEQVAVACHGGVVNAWASHILDRDEMFFVDVGYASISRFLVSSRGHTSINSLNEMPHLRGIS